MSEYHMRVFDLGIPFDRKKQHHLLGWILRRDAPIEYEQLMKKMDSFSGSHEGMRSVGNHVRWGRSQACESVNIAFGHDGKLKLVLGWEYKNSRYTPMAVAVICKKVIQIVLALQEHGVIGGNDEQ